MNRAKGRRAVLVVSMLSPWLIGFAALTAYPIVISAYYSFTRYSFGTVDPQWIGWDNYTYLFTKDPNFGHALRNTLFLAAVGLPLRMLVAFVTAGLLATKRRGAGIYRVLYYLPTLVPSVAGALLFTFLLQPEYGPVNRLLHALGVSHPPLWFFDPNWSKPALTLISIWSVGDTMLILLAGLLNVPRTLYEAVELDGGGPWTKFRHVTFPMVSPVTFFILVTGLIGVLQSFDEAYISSSAAAGPQAPPGAPEGSLLTYPLMQLNAFQHNRVGYASAMAWVMFLMTLVLTALVTVSRKRWVHTSAGEA
ncbi:sugar ABC transporter permease [Actinoplanes sp. NPDC026619]|uniref:carbohydrate ABC transporter permease n=1 Tax=Actinoplanes sp. NPDC026619 TaxID=3155798 RepID=UPI0033EBDEC4